MDPVDPLDPLGLFSRTPSPVTPLGEAGEDDNTAPDVEEEEEEEYEEDDESLEGPIASEDGSLTYDPLQEPDTDSSFPDETPRNDVWGRRERAGKRLQRWIANEETPNDPCPVRACRLGPDDLNPLLHTAVQETKRLREELQVEIEALGYPANRYYHVSIIQPVGPNIQPFIWDNPQRNAWEAVVGENILNTDYMYRYRGERGFHSADVFTAIYRYYFPMNSLKSVIFNTVLNKSTLRQVQRLYTHFNLFPTTTVPLRDAWLEHITWPYGSSEYRALLGSHMGRTVAYLVLAAFPRGSHRISQIVTWYVIADREAFDENDRAELYMRFDIEPILHRSPLLEGLPLDRMDGAELAREGERMTARGRKTRRPPPVPAGDEPAPVAPLPLLPPVFGTPHESVAIRRFERPSGEPTFALDPKGIFVRKKHDARKEAAKMILEKARPKPKKGEHLPEPFPEPAPPVAKRGRGRPRKVREAPKARPGPATPTRGYDDKRGPEGPKMIPEAPRARPEVHERFPEELPAPLPAPVPGAHREPARASARRKRAASDPAPNSASRRKLLKLYFPGEAEKIEVKMPDPRKTVAELEKAKIKKLTPKKETLKKETPKKATPKKATPKKAEPKKAEPKKRVTRKTKIKEELKKLEAKDAETENDSAPPKNVPQFQLPKEELKKPGKGKGKGKRVAPESQKEEAKRQKR
ncbi:hypothetical protein N7490_011075 [Penicillium lividum]|nr:hypothetical protein N7490_011075 [Penicillium lividum]